MIPSTVLLKWLHNTYSYCSLSMIHIAPQAAKTRINNKTIDIKNMYLIFRANIILCYIQVVLLLKGDYVYLNLFFAGYFKFYMQMQ